MARLFGDEDYHHGVVRELIRLGHDVVTVLSLGLAGRGVGDPTVLALATADGRAVLSHNKRHFIRLHLADPNHTGIIVCTRDDDNPVALAARVHAALSACPDLTGQLIRVYKLPQPPPATP